MGINGIGRFNLDETRFVPVVSPVPRKSPLLDHDKHSELIHAALQQATQLGKVEIPIFEHVERIVDGVFSLARYQTPFKAQNDRGTCWAFAGAAALEAAYRRNYNIEIDLSEEYIFHIGKAFALNGDTQVAVENNSSLTGFQGSADICQKLTENAVPLEGLAPYFPTQQSLENILPTLGYANAAAVMSQEDFDALEFSEQHIPLLARVNARYRATDWATLGSNPTVEALENTLLSMHEVVCDVTTPSGGHVLLLIGFDRNRRVFFAKNHWGENDFIEIQYQNDPNWTIDTGWYIKDVVDPTFVQNEPCWVGNWWMTIGGVTNRLLIRRVEEFLSPMSPTRLGSVYQSDGRHDVNGHFLNGGSQIRLFIAPTTTRLAPGTLAGTRIDAHLDFSDIYNATGTTDAGQAVTLTRFTTRFAAIFEQDNGYPWEARHGIDGATYQSTFDALVQRGFCPTSVCGYSEGANARYNAIWEQRSDFAWEARHGLTAEQYQEAFNNLVNRGYRLTNISGYAINGEARYAAIWQQRPGPAWQARHGMTRDQYQQAFNDLAQQGYVLTQISGYRVNVDVLFAAIWEKQENVIWQVRHGLTSSAYQATFNQMLADGYRLAWVCGYSDTGIVRYAAIWRQENIGAWQANHGMDAAGYQRTFDDLKLRGYRPVHVSGYGDGFYPA